VNHAKIAAEALRFRMRTLQHSLVDPGRFDIEAAAAVAVTCGDPLIDSAMRRLGTAWQRAGLDPEDLVEPWHDADATRLLDTCGSSVIDALDDILRGVSAQAIST
jgi:hypothetical protein